MRSQWGLANVSFVVRRFHAIVLAVSIVGELGPAAASTSGSDVESLKRAVVANYAAIVEASYVDARNRARALARSIDAFIDAPNTDSLNRARQAWLDARVPYVQTESYRFADGPIEAVEGFINSWPIDEQLIDYVDGEPGAGIINHSVEFPRITGDLIASLNEKDGERNITTGFHAIEFLLWGQDLNDAGPGQRTYLDYVDGGAPHAERRREYLHLAGALLVTHLEALVQAWAPDTVSNYRARFVAMPPDEALASVLKGIGILSGAELAGERLTVPYETKEQEDEHSCFSDHTHLDIVYDTIGIENVFLGRYISDKGEHVAGPGVRELLAVVDPALARRLEIQVRASVKAARGIPPPFDRAILGADSAPGRVTVKKTIVALRAQADMIAEAGAALGLRLNF